MKLNNPGCGLSQPLGTGNSLLFFTADLRSNENESVKNRFSLSNL
ncbi:unnamed protein product [Nezara viridula]|uniref:Uncharacterized protein n=1 Tax=Nezara viridula TaxID=85310 RepID=A0A9P0H1L7_NEZVI|nr:unnamed protein product [Nezara viridula]